MEENIFVSYLVILLSFAFFLTAKGERPVKNVILVSIDSLRADHVNLYGYPRTTMPFLTQMVEKERASFFERMTAVNPSCTPSHVSMLTGLYPHQSAKVCAKDMLVKNTDLTTGGINKRLSNIPKGMTHDQFLNSAVVNLIKVRKNTPFLSKLLQEKDFLTAGFISLWPLHRRYGYNLGFDHFEDDLPDSYAKDKVKAKILKEPTYLFLHHVLKSQRRQEGDRLIENVGKFLFKNQESLNDGKRLFMFLHLSDTHVSYDGGTERFNETKEERQALIDHWRNRYTKQSWKKSQKKLMMREKINLLEQYDRSIKKTDRQLERLFQYLEEIDEANRTLIVITSDHGDSFGQHMSKRKPFFEHSLYVWEETQHIPLILIYPKDTLVPKASYPHNVSHVDLVPTILDFLRIPYPWDKEIPLLGRSVKVPLDVEKFTRSYFMTFGRGKHPIMQLTPLGLPRYPRFIGFKERDQKFFMDKKFFQTGKRGKCSLYYLDEDPHEKNNRCNKNAPEIQRWRSEVIQWYNNSL